MDYNILITGAAGYIGGALLNELLTEQQSIVPSQNIITVVRSDEQALSLSALGVNAVCADLSDTDVIIQLVLEKNIGLVVHCASALDASLAKPLLSGLGKRIQKTGRAAYFIHTSGASAFADQTGWPHGEVSDTDQVHAVIKQISSPYIVRQVDKEIIDLSSENNVTSFTVVPPLVYGRGAGVSTRISSQLSAYIRASIRNKAVYKFAKDSEWQAVHVTDLARFYVGLLRCLVNGKVPASGQDGYFFASAHKLPWWNLLDCLASRLHAKGLVSTADVDVWPSEDLASNTFGMPIEYVRIGWNSNSITLCRKGEIIGWKPIWNYEMLLEAMDDEIEKVQDARPDDKMMALPSELFTSA